MPKLTPKQRKFADEYIISLNATQAAIRAGYSPKTANRIASENLSKLDVQIYIEERQKKIQKKMEIKQEDVIKELATIGFAKITDFVEIKCGHVMIKDTSEMPEDKIGAISSIEEGNFGIKLKLNNKLDALDKIGRHLGMFKDNQSQQTADNNLLEQLGESIEQIDIDVLEGDNEI